MIYELIAEYCKMQLEKNNGCRRRIQKEELLEAAGGGDESCIRMIRVAQMDEFERALDQLCRDQILSPVVSSKVRGAAVPSYEKYLLNGTSRTKEYDSGYRKQLYAYPGTRVPEYYRAKKAEFEKDKGYMDRIYGYWQQKEKLDLTANELGFYLFHSEKAFEQPEKNKKSSGRALEVLNRMGLSLNDLGVRHAPEPFFHISYPGLYDNRQHRVLITENKDTYYTVMEKMAGFGYDCVIFGEGKKILSSFAVAEDYGIGKGDAVHYFGDLDPEGLSIYAKFRRRYGQMYEISLRSDWYQALASAYDPETLPLTETHVMEEAMREALPVLEELPEDTAARLIKLFEEGRYIPQEAVAPIWLGIGQQQAGL